MFIQTIFGNCHTLRCHPYRGKFAKHFWAPLKGSRFPDAPFSLVFPSYMSHGSIPNKNQTAGGKMKQLPFRPRKTPQEKNTPIWFHLFKKLKAWIFLTQLPRFEPLPPPPSDTFTLLGSREQGIHSIAHRGVVCWQ